MDLATARCRFGKYLRVAVGEKTAQVARLLREFSARRESTEDGRTAAWPARAPGAALHRGQEAAVANYNWARPIAPIRPMLHWPPGAPRPLGERRRGGL